MDDGASSAADHIASALDNLAGKFMKAHEAQEKSASGYGRFMAAVDHSISVVRELGRALMEVGRFGAEGVGFVLEAAQFKENTQLALEAILRSKEEANAVMAESVAFAAKTPFRTTDIMEFTKQFRVAGFSQSDTSTLLKVVGDFGALNNMDTGAMERVVFHLKQIKSEGHLTGMQMHQLALAGLNSDRIYNQLARTFGTTAEGARALVHGGQVSSQAAIFSIANAMADMAGGKAGMLLEKSSKTLTGLLSTVRSRPEELAMFVADTGGFNKLKGFLSNVADLFDPNSEFGGRVKDKLAGTFDRAFTAIFGSFAGPDGAEKLEGALDVLLAGVDGLVDGLSTSLGPAFSAFTAGIGGNKTAADEFRSSMKALGVSLGEVASFLGMLAKGLAFVAEGWNKLIGGVDWSTAGSDLLSLLGRESDAEQKKRYGMVTGLTPEAAARSMGIGVGEGYVKGLMSTMPGIGDAGEELADKTVQSVTGPLQIHSPSRVMERLGQHTAEGFTRGLDRAQVPELRTPRLGGALGGRGGAFAPSITINVAPGAGMGGGEVHSLVKQIKDAVASELAAAMEQFSLEMGVA